MNIDEYILYNILLLLLSLCDLSLSPQVVPQQERRHGRGHALRGPASEHQFEAPQRRCRVRQTLRGREGLKNSLERFKTSLKTSLKILFKIV